MAEQFQVQGLATFKTDPRGDALQVLGTLPDGMLLCLRSGETQVKVYDPTDLYIFATGPVHQPPKKV